jgi:hypothetical protein
MATTLRLFARRACCDAESKMFDRIVTFEKYCSLYKKLQTHDWDQRR